jgi:hypothetical protein
MPGPQDHLAEQGRAPDHSRPREADVPHETRVRSDDLQARLERLPANHPSSPFRDDGTRKPPPVDLSKYELPLPDDPDSPADPDLPAADQARTDPDGSWDWKGYHLTPEQNRAADRGLARCREAEGRDAEGNYGDHGLTPTMRRIEAPLEHGHLVEGTEKFALKDPDSFKEKLTNLIARNPDKPYHELAHEIHDAIRYTFIFTVESYTDSMWDTQGKIEAAGYQLEVWRNSWESQEYKGINSRWLEPTSGQLFEIQFHTRESWEAKQKTHPAYERIKDPRTPADELRSLREYQKRISGAVEIPSGAADIPEYRRDGR